jgi:hypothetical protein
LILEFHDLLLDWSGALVLATIAHQGTHPTCAEQGVFR